MTMTERFARERVHREFTADPARCAHARRRYYDPAGPESVWLRCTLCGAILAEVPRCTGRGQDGYRCLSDAGELGGRCQVHAG